MASLPQRNLLAEHGLGPRKYFWRIRSSFWL